MNIVRVITLAAYAQYAVEMIPSAWSELETAVTAALDSDAAREVIIAEHSGRIVGSVMLYPPGNNAYGVEAITPDPEVRLLAVSPDARGLGVGRALMDECMKRSRAKGAEYLGLHTSQSMKAAMSLYTRMGFERAPDRDFRVNASELVEGYRLRLPPL